MEHSGNESDRKDQKDSENLSLSESPTTQTGLGLNLGLHSKRLARIWHYNTVTSTLPAASCLLLFVSLKELLAVDEIILLPDVAASSAVLVLPVAFPPMLSK